MLFFILEYPLEPTRLSLPKDSLEPERVAGDLPSRKASPLQVAATMFCGIFAIGARGTWHKSGATVTFRQVVIGAAITLIVLVTVLMVLVKLAVR